MKQKKKFLQPKAVKYFFLCFILRDFKHFESFSRSVTRFLRNLVTDREKLSKCSRKIFPELCSGNIFLPLNEQRGENNKEKII